MTSKELTKVQDSALTAPGEELKIDGLAGFESSDMPVPFINFLSKNSDEALLQDGTQAPAGSFYNAGTQEVLNPFIFRILATAKGESWSKKANQGEGAMVKTIVIYGREEKSGELFLMRITSAYAYYEFKKRVLPVVAKAIKSGNNILDVVFQGDKAMADNEKFGKISYAVFKLNAVKPLEKAERAQLIAMQGAYTKLALDNVTEGEDVSEGAEEPTKKKRVIVADEPVDLNNVELPPA